MNNVLEFFLHTNNLKSNHQVKNVMQEKFLELLFFYTNKVIKLKISRMKIVLELFFAHKSVFKNVIR